MIKQLMLYGSSLWCSTSIENLKNVFKLQKRVARVILESKIAEGTVDLFNRLGWMPFYDEAKFSIYYATPVYKYLNI